MVWSNTAVTIRGRCRVMYDSGETDEILLNETASGSSRAAVLVTAGVHMFNEDGVIVNASIAGTATQRGQTWVQGLILSDAIGSGGTYVIMAGYVWQAQILNLGEYQIPGPAGGSGQFRLIQTADPAANAEIADQVVPVGAIWLLRSFWVQLVQGITQTPLPTLEFEDVAGTVVVAVIPITPTALAASSTAQLTWGIGLVQTSFTSVVGDEFHTAPLPVIYLTQLTGGALGAGLFATLTDGIGANTNYGPATYEIEEWVMPN